MSHTKLMFMCVTGAAFFILLPLYHVPTYTSKVEQPTQRSCIPYGSAADSSFFVLNKNKPVDDTTSREHPVCKKTSTSEVECNDVNKHKVKLPSRFPLQFVSGAPGSGNDWILWLASLNQDQSCEVYRMMNHRSDSATLTNAIKTVACKPSKCLFFKTHEPWFVKNPFIYQISIKTALLLRHPYDAAFAEYKRKLILHKVSKQEEKNSIKGITVEKFFILAKNSTNQKYMSYLTSYVTLWERHMHFWLNNYTGPLHVMIYNNIREDTKREIEDMQRFFGYQFNDEHLRNHCCKMNRTLNPNLKRKPSEVDTYKERIYENLGDIRLNFEALAKETNTLLAQRYPGRNLTIERG